MTYPDYAMISTARLPYGQFFGDSESRREIPGFSLARMTPVLPPDDVPLHTHEQASFVVLLSGAYISSARGAGSECKGPLLIYNPPGTTHRDRFKTMAGRFLAISVAPDSFRHAAESVTLPGDATAFRSRDVVTVAQRLSHDLDRWDEASPLHAEGVCLEMFAAVARRSAEPGGKSPDWLAGAKEFLHDRCTGHVRIVDAASAIGVHPVYFARSFRKFLRCTPGEYLTRCRLNKAASLLLETALPLADIALQAGFFDQSHFSKVFKRNFGLTPRSYRRIFRSKRVQIFPFGSVGTRNRSDVDEILG